MANEYTSDLFVARTGLDPSLFLILIDNSRSSGARQRVDPFPFGVEALAERPSIVIDESPKSVRRGVPSESIRMFDWIPCSA